MALPVASSLALPLQPAMLSACGPFGAAPKAVTADLLAQPPAEVALGEEDLGAPLALEVGLRGEVARLSDDAVSSLQAY